MFKQSVKTKISTCFFGAALSLFLCVHIAQAAVPYHEVRLNKDTVTVGDVFNGAGNDADHVLAPAPAYGKTLVLNANDLQRISDAFDLGWSASRDDLMQTIIRRDGKEIDLSDIESTLKKKLVALLPKGQIFDIDLDSGQGPIVLPTTAAATLDVTRMKYDAAHQTFSAFITAPAGKSPLARRAVSGHLYVLTPVPVLAQAEGPDDIISAQDVQYINMRSGDISANTVIDAKNLIGQTPRRNLAALRPIDAGDISPPVLVKKGEIVTLTLQNGPIALTAQGRAVQSGADGDIVRVINTTSNQAIEGEVTGLRTVAVHAAAGNI